MSNDPDDDDVSPAEMAEIQQAIAAAITSADEVIRLTTPQPLFKGTVTGAGGGVVDVLVDRETERYPNLGDEVVVYLKADWEQLGL